MKDAGESFDQFLWQFCRRETEGPTPWKTLSRVWPARDERIHGDERSAGSSGAFAFVGPTIVYAFMQAVGMVKRSSRDLLQIPRTDKMM